MMNFLTAITLTLLVTVYCQEPVKICVSEQLQESCRQMEQDIPDKFTCVIGRDWVDCAQKMQKKEADVTNMDIRAVYMAGKFFGGAPLAAEVSEGSSIYYNGVALVEKGSDIKTPADLRGKRACHTAYGRTAWQLSLARLMSIGVLQPQSCKEGSQGSMEFLRLVDDFFSGGSCASGNRSFDPLVDQEIKNRFPGLCSRCKDPESCSWEDEYLGYQGVIHCLLDDSGDVSFTSIKAVKEFLKKDSSLAEKVDLLCPEGGTAELTPDGEGLQSCFWGFRASNAFMSTQETIQEKGERVLSVILETQALYKPVQIHIPEWYHKSFLSSSFVDGVEPVDPNRNDYRSYLGDDYVYSIEGPQCQSVESNVMNWCVISEHEKSKCEDYAKAAVSRGLWPEIGCVLATSKAACMELIKNEHANLVTLDGGDVYKAGRYFDLLPVSAEMYGDLDASYFSVAVIRSVSDVSKLSELRGLRSCHTGMGRTAGWVVPLGSLIRDGSIEADQCDRAAAVAGFFEAGSCVPGANDTKYNPGRSNADKLCQQCIGDNEGRFKCSRDSKERYSGYAGAFRCLSEGRGDVAFVKHTTAKEYTDGRSSDDWARDLLSSDFQLLCGRGGNAPIQEYSRCNLAKVPSHYVMTNSDATADDRLKIAKFLASSSEYFYDKYTSLFRIFGSYGSGIGQKDLIFKDSTTSLKAIPFTSSYIDAIGEDFYTASEAVDPKACQNTS